MTIWLPCGPAAAVHVEAAAQHTAGAAIAIAETVADAATTSLLSAPSPPSAPLPPSDHCDSQGRMPCRGAPRQPQRQCGAHTAVIVREHSPRHRRLQHRRVRRDIKVLRALRCAATARPPCHKLRRRCCRGTCMALVSSCTMRVGTSAALASGADQVSEEAMQEAQ